MRRKIKKGLRKVINFIDIIENNEEKLQEI
jgi:hypothetical protein